MSFRIHLDFEIHMIQETYEDNIKELKQEYKKLQDKYDLLVIMTTDTKKKKKQKVVMTPEQEEICEMFRMDL
jgi:glycine cleavage system regulatory protein